MPEYRVLRIDEQLYGCEELPAGQPVLCDVTLTDAAGAARILPYPDKELTYSPLSRAADTAKAIAAATGLPARCEPRLREQCFGKYEGTPRDGAEFRISKTHFADRYDGGESMMQLAQRIYNLLDELKADTGKTYLLVAHNGIARVVHSYFYDMTNEEYAAAGIKNCQLVEYTFE